MPLSNQVVETHPLLADLPIFDEQVIEIADSIREVGLLHPLTVDPEGRLIGGRHRFAACERAEVEPTYETYDGDVESFVAHDNAARKHQTTAQVAAERALVFDNAGRRKGGRWKRGTVAIGESANSAADWNSRLKECGLILDHLGRDALIAVASGDLTLNAAYEQARAAKDADDERRAEESREAEREANAKTFIETKDPGLAAKVGGDAIATYQEAVAVWERRNREEVAEQKRQKQERLASIDRDKRRIEAFLGGYFCAKTLTTNPERDAVLDALAPRNRERFLLIEKEISWPTTD